MTVTLDNGFQLYDSELAKLLDLFKELNEELLGRDRVDRDALTHKIKERCEKEAGVIVRVDWYTCGEPMPDGSLREIPGKYMPEPIPIGRVTKGEYDHDRQRHEVINDVLGIGDGGVIKMTASEARQALETGRAHKHGKGCGH